MESKEIRDIAIDSSTIYYDYLNKNNRGIQEVDVHEFSCVDSRNIIYKLKLSAKLFDTEAVFFKNLKNNRNYDIQEVKIIEYDRDKNILLIKPTENIQLDFQDLRNADLKVISDLKFLVLRVRAWYELNGGGIHLPTVTSKIKNQINEIKYFAENPPSKNQIESLKNIFTNPFSYVWGAPGTGKTKFVLSYAVMHYINNNYRIAILAPTNNSIEQVLRGVICMTDKAGINRKNIIRLGTPSKKFAEEFPEVCEEKGRQKNITEIDKQINILERVIAYERSLSQLNVLEENSNLFNDIHFLIEKFKTAKILYQKEFEKSKRKEIDINYAKEELNKFQNRKEKELNELNSFTNRLKKFFLLESTVTKINIDQTEESIKNKYKEIEFLKYELSEINVLLLDKKNNLNKTDTGISRTLDKIKLLFGENSNIKKIVYEINIDNFEIKQSLIKQEISTEKELLERDSYLFADYKDTSFQQLHDELDQHIATRKKLTLFSTEERLKTVKVIACTLDGYIGRYTDSKLNVEHIFLDEAGYANVIKTLTLFNHNVPISFLGDHMQLPPVCEINDSEIKNDEHLRNIFLWSQSAIHLDSLFQKTRNICLNEYLENTPLNSTSLTKTALTSTFRFSNSIAKILANHVYDGNFNSSSSFGETEILFVDAPKIDSLRSRISITEVKAIKIIIEKLKSLNKNDFAILTPYKKQLKLLNNELPQERNDLKTLTVHGSQGREWDIVILSVVDTSDKFFVDSTLTISKGLNLINTAVSRAKKQLIIVCDKTYWINQEEQLITDLLKNGTEFAIETNLLSDPVRRSL